MISGAGSAAIARPVRFAFRATCMQAGAPHMHVMTNDSVMMSSPDARLDRQFARIGRQVPAAAGFLGWIRRPRMHLVRIPLALLLILGGVFSFLPVLGVWMLPLGLGVLAVDLPPLRRPVGNLLVRGQRWLSVLRRRWRR